MQNVIGSEDVVVYETNTFCYQERLSMRRQPGRKYVLKSDFLILSWVVAFREAITYPEESEEDGSHWENPLLVSFRPSVLVSIVDFMLKWS